MVLFSQRACNNARAACADNCMDCEIHDVGAPIIADVSDPDTIYVCVQAQNPPNSGSWTGEDWFNYFGATLYTLDVDLKNRNWRYAGFADPDPDCYQGCLGTNNDPQLYPPGCNCNCVCYDSWNGWEQFGDGHLVVSWSGTVDLTQTGTYTITATVCNADPPTGPEECVELDDPDFPSWAKDSCQEATLTIRVVEADIDIEGLADEDEADPPGAILSLNNDDDNENGVPDLNENPVAGENDLKQITLSAWQPEPGNEADMIWSLSWYSPDRLKVWPNPDKSGTPVPNGEYFTFAEKPLPQTFYVEGLQTSAFPADTAIFLQVSEDYAENRWVYCSDVVVVTVVDVDITPSAIVAGDKREPGLYLNVNWDDDDSDGWTNNGVPPDAVYTGDKDDGEITGGDDDLRFFWVSVQPSLDQGTVTLTFPGSVKVWETNTKVDDGSSAEIASGAQFNVSDLPGHLYLEAVQGSGAFKDIEVKAVFQDNGMTSDDAFKATSFEVALTTIIAGAQQCDNDKKFSTLHLSSDVNGIISWDDPDPNCEYFHNTLEIQGTLKPPKVVGVNYPGAFDIRREKWTRLWIKTPPGDWENVPSESPPWKPDDSDNGDEDLTPSDPNPAEGCAESNHIYAVDGPGYGSRIAPPDFKAYVSDFREWVEVQIGGIWYRCSDQLRWHAQLYLKPDGSGTQLIRDAANLQKLGPGWIDVPIVPASP